MSSLDLFWLGNPSVHREGKPVKLETRKSLALLAYLSLAKGGVSRELLASLFWPEFDQQHAMANLRRNLASLSKALGEGWIEADREEVRLGNHDTVTLDVEAFHKSLAFVREHSHPDRLTCHLCNQSLTQAVRLCRGDFLEGFNLPDCSDFDEWQFFQRESLRQELATALERLAQSQAFQANWEEAITYARRWVSLDQLNETAQRFLIDLYVQSGQSSAAIRQYEECTRLLQEELGQAPQAETTAVFQALLDKTRQMRPSLQRNSHLSMQVAAPVPHAAPLLKTKLFIPVLAARRVSRPHLFTLLDKGTQGSLTVVSAPAGFGKTTLLAQWIAGIPMRAAWLSLDSEDNDPIRFLIYLVTACRNTIVKEKDDFGGTSLSMLGSFPPSPASFILSSLINDASLLDTPFLLILDDYQFITNPAVHEALAYLIQRQPAQLRLVIATRADPPLLLARLRASGRVTEIRAQDLRFTIEESHEYLTQVMDLDLSIDQVAALDARTEGWVAGLQMAALSMRNRQDLGSFIRNFSGSHRYVLDYLVEEVLNLQTDPIKTFLLQTSILERMCGPLCDAILRDNGLEDKGLEAEQTFPYPQSPAQGILEYLDRSNLFLIPLDDERGWFRYHHLFADLLRSRLGQLYPDKIAQLHLYSADWLIGHGYAGEAIAHALAARDYDRTISWIKRSVNELIKRGEATTVLNWLDQIPSSLLTQHPLLCAVKALIYVDTNRNLAEGELLIQNIEQHIDPARLTSEEQNALGIAYISRALMADLLGDIPTTAIYLDRARLYLAEDSFLLPIAAITSGDLFFYEGRLADAAQAWTEALQLVEKNNGSPGMIIGCMNALARCRWMEGRLRDAMRIYQRAQALPSSPIPTGMFAMYKVGYANLLREWNELDTARQELQDIVAAIQQNIDPSGLGEAYAFLGRILLSLGELAEAEDICHKADQHLEMFTVFPDVTAQIGLCKVRLYLRRGQLREAERVQQECETQAWARIRIIQDWVQTSRARLLLAQGQTKDALDLLDELVIETTTGGRKNSLIENLVLQALAFHGIGESPRAVEALRKCLTLAEPEGYLRVFLDEGQPLNELLLEMLLQPTEEKTEHIQKLLEAFDTR